MPQVMRSMFAVMFGFIVMILAKVLFTEILLKMLGSHPDPTSSRTLVLSLSFAMLAAMIGGVMTATFAGVSPIQHAGALAIIVFALSGLPFLRHTSAQPIWYQELLLVLPSLCILGGAAIYSRTVTSRPA